MKIFYLLAISLWLSAIAFGLYRVGQYETDAGQSSLAPEHFPFTSHLARVSNIPTLLFFAHPKCPCSRASLNELAHLSSETGSVTIHVIFSKPVGAAADWADTRLRYDAEKMPGVTVTVDEDEAETDAFNARTSGTVLLYDADGILKFNGGLTIGRGIEGLSDGGRAIAKIIRGNVTDANSSPVFGCPLRSHPD